MVCEAPPALLARDRDKDRSPHRQRLRKCTCLFQPPSRRRSLVGPLEPRTVISFCGRGCDAFILLWRCAIIPRARTAEFVEPDQADLGCPVPFAKTFPFVSDPNQNYKRAIPFRLRGLSRSSRTLGTGCGGRQGSADERC